MRMDRNAEGYHDPTAFEACKNIIKEERAAEGDRLYKIGLLIPILRDAAELAGFEIIGRIPLRDIETGKEYR